jgi:acetoin:2,6-dichlorophenolindophenol oxidoreductase subunit alpha
MTERQPPTAPDLPPPAQRPGKVDWIRTHARAAAFRMQLIRELESRLPRYTEARLISGSTHPSVGMEAVSVGVGMALEPGDAIASTHRGHGHCLARGADPYRLLCELFGRRDGYCGGKGGSMHIADRELGILGTNGIVGASMGIATGAALAARLQGTRDVAVAFFGDGAINQGMFHEALNLASIWALSVVFVCENNHYAQSAAISDMVAVTDLSRRAASFGMQGIPVDGMDVYQVWSATTEAVGKARRGNGPTLLVADTWRFSGHMVGDTERYRSPDDHGRWRTRDPIDAVWSDIDSEMPVDPERGRAAVERQVRDLVDDAERRARANPAPAATDAFTDVYGRIITGSHVREDEHD